jgi:tetratricopeptide (TPR) repeat protein
LQRRRALARSAALAALLIGACTGKDTPQNLLQQAEARLAANDPAGAEQLLREALADAPNDPNLRIVLARAELATGNPAAAEGSLDRAMKLGAAKEEVAGDLARALLAEGEQQRVIDLVGDIGQWPQPRRLSLALSRAEAALALPAYEPRDLTKSFLNVFRLRSTAPADGAIADLQWLDRHLTELRAKSPAVEGGYQHFACEREPTALEPANGGTPTGRACSRSAPINRCGGRATQRALRRTTTSSRSRAVAMWATSRFGSRAACCCGA